jgi:pyocin large subunit-like protein
MHRDTHFLKHGADFGASTAEEYEQMAEEFMFGERDKNTRECTRPNHGQRIRFDFWSRRFGSAESAVSEHLRTFYRVRQAHIDYHGGENAYFGWECGRINV